MAKEVPKYVTADEIMEGAVPSSIFEEMRRKREQDRRNAGPIPFCQTAAGQQAAAWSELGDLIVGAEYKGPQRFP